MTRRALLLAGAAWTLQADDAQQVWDLLTEMAAALSDNKAEEFLRPFDRAMHGYNDLRQNIEALLLTYEVHSSIELLDEKGDSTTQTVELDWFLQLVEKQDPGGVTRRREPVRCTLVKQGKKWRITSLQPLSFFAPPKTAP